MQIHELPSGTPTEEDLIPFDTGQANYKTPFSGFDVGENTATFTSGDEADPAQFKTVGTVESGPIKTILNKLSMAVSNIRYIWKVLSAVVSKTAIINYSATDGSFSIYHDDAHRMVLNVGGSGRYELFRLDAGDMSMTANNTQGTFDLRLDSSVNHRFYISDGSNESYTESMVIRCGSVYIERPASGDRLNLVAPSGVFINGNRMGIAVATISGSASAAGNFSHTFSGKVLVLAAYTTLSDTYIVPYPTSGASTTGTALWWFHVWSAVNNAAVSGSVTATVWYIALE